MAHFLNKQPLKDDVIKVLAPHKLKNELQDLAEARNISLSALVRLILTEYVKSKR